MNFELLTSRNVGAISVFSISGDAEEIADFMSRFWRIKRSGSMHKVNAPRVNQIVYGFFVDEDEIVDEALLIGISENILELHVHGGFGVVDRVTQILLKHGFRRTENNTNVITQLFVSARTKNEAQFILAQSKLLKLIAKEMLRQISDKDYQSIKRTAQEMLAQSELLEILQNPPVVFLLGKPNVGKSTLFNQIAGFERVITSDVSGTTRDVVSQIVNVKGWSIKLSDAAGVRKTDDYIEKRSVVRSLRKVREAGLIIFITDLSTEMTDEENQIIAELENLNHIKIANKADVVKKTSETTEAIEISAKTGEGIDELKEKILEKLGFYQLDKRTPLPIPPFTKQVLQEILDSEDLSNLRELLDNISKSFDINVI